MATSRRGLGMAVAIGMALQAGCLRTSPYDTSLTEDERNLTAKNVRKLGRVERAPVSAAAPLTFAFVSDTHDGYDHFDQIVSAINARSDVEFTLHGGDLTDLGMKLEFVWAEQTLATLRAPFFVAPGNHDGLANGRILYSEMFGATNFDFAYAGVHFVVLNTNTLEWGMPEPDLDWLERTLDAPGYSSTVVLSHQPPLSKPHLNAEVAERMSAILERAGVSLYLYGHIHRGLVLRTEGPTIFAKTDAGLHGSWMVVRTDGASFEFELCHLDQCAPARAADPESAEALQ